MFSTKANWLKRGWGKYCSRKCQFSAQRKGEVVLCCQCGKSVYRSPRALKKSNSGKYFCSKHCSIIWKNVTLHSGNRHPNWRGGSSAYRNILIRKDVPQVCIRCGLDDRRVLIAHHVDHIRSHNSIKNLVWLCCNCHSLVHGNQQENDQLVRSLIS